MNRRKVLGLTLLCAAASWRGNRAPAAPPSVTHLFPAGGQRGTTVEVTAAGTFERWPVLGRISGEGVSVKAGREKGTLTVTVAGDAEPGTRWLWLYDEQGASVPRPFVVGTLPEVREHEPNDEPKAAQRLPFAAVTVNGRLQKPGDVDCFAVWLQQGQTLVAALDAWATLRSPMDAVLQIVSADGFVLDQNNDFHGLDPFIAFPVPKDGLYVVRAFAFPAVPDASIRFSGGESYVYRLTLTTGGYADYAWPLAVSRDNPGTVRLMGWNLPGGEKGLPVKPRDLSDDSAVFHIAVANPVRVRVEPHPSVVKPDTAEPFVVEPPVTVTGRLARPRAVDAFEIRPSKPQKLTARVESASVGLPIAAELRIADGSGKELVRAEPAGVHGDTEVSFIPPMDGPCRLTVRDLYGGGGSRYAYRLRVTPAEPDFALTAAADRFTVAAGQSLDVPVAMRRMNGFAGGIELTVEGLPPGVEATAMHGKDPAKLTVQLTARADAAGAGPFRIVGRAKSGLAAARVATAVVPPPFDAAPVVHTESIWVTVTRPPAAGAK